MRDLVWYQDWSIPVYDEPEDSPAGWPAFLAANAGKPIAVAHWDIAKAKSMGVWAEGLPNLQFLLFNWYPACSAVPRLFRWAYVPFLAAQYRFWYSKRAVPCYLTLWSKERGPLTDEHGNHYWYGVFWNAWSFFFFKLLLWPRETGKAYF